MSTSLDLRLRPKALALIAKYGKSVTWTQYAGQETGYTPQSGTTSLGLASNYPVKCTPPAPVDTRYLGGDLIVATDVEIYIAGLGLAFTPKLNDRVTIDGTVYTVLAKNAIYSGEDIVLWWAAVRR